MSRFKIGHGLFIYRLFIYRLFILFIIFTFFILAACQGQKSIITDQQVRGQIEKESSEQLPELPLRTFAPSYASDIQLLVDKSAAISSYKYAYDAFQAETFTVFHHSSGDHKVYLTHQKQGKDRLYNHVYLDALSKKAWGACTDSEVLCQGLFKKAFPVSWDQEHSWTDPLALMKNLPSDAQKVGTEEIDQRSNIILEYINAEGFREWLWVDIFYGFPMQQVIFGESKAILTKHQFTRPEINRVTEEDVSLPEGYQFIS